MKMENKNFKAFHFKKYDFNKETLTLNLFYSIDDKIEFKEALKFNNLINFSNINEKILNVILKNVHLAFGISYYKTFCPLKMIIETESLTKNESIFWNEFYTNGLGEFFFKNKISPIGLINFPYDEEKMPTNFNINLKNQSLLPIGGGKDSILSANILKNLSIDITAFSLNTHPLIEEGIKILGLDRIFVTRTLSENIFTLNKEGALNGHVPITGCISFLLILTAYLYNYSDIILSLEHSASEEQAYIGNFKVNHQYSKSLDFEKMFTKHIAENISPNFNFYSLLRPFNELKIASLFANSKIDCKKHFISFSSCNKNFKIKDPLKERWCTSCPKCAFVFLLFAPFLNDKTLLSIFGKNFLAINELKDTYLELLGLTENRPFECVGSLEETLSAFYLLHKQKRFLDTAPMIEFEKKILKIKGDKILETLTNKVLSFQDDHCIKNEKIINLLKTL